MIVPTLAQIRLGALRSALRWLPALATPEIVAALRQRHEVALVAGVRPTQSEWESLSTPEQDAWAQAGVRVEAARAARSGIASASVDAAVEIASIADGGSAKRELQAVRSKAQDRANLEAAVDRAHRHVLHGGEG